MIIITEASIIAKIECNGFLFTLHYLLKRMKSTQLIGSSISLYSISICSRNLSLWRKNTEICFFSLIFNLGSISVIPMTLQIHCRQIWFKIYTKRPKWCTFQVIKCVQGKAWMQHAPYSSETISSSRNSKRKWNASFGFYPSSQDT